MRYFNKNKPKIVLSALTHVNLISILAKTISQVKIRLVISEHAIVSEISKNTKQFSEKLYPILMRLLYRFSNHIIAVSNAVSEDIVNITKVNLNKITTIHNPVDLRSIRINLENKNGFIKTSQYQIIGVGRLSKEKDFTTLIKAFYYIQKEIDASLVILGEGNQYTKLKRYIRKYGLESRVLMPGFVDKPETFITKSDVLCLSSISEGFGNVVVESMALGVPVVATNCGGPREILEDGTYGKLVPVGDYIEMSNAVLKIIKDGQKLPSTKNLENRFGISKVSKKYIDVLLNK